MMSGIYWDELVINYQSRDFPVGRVPPWRNLSTTWGDILWAAVTVGRPNTAFVFQHADASYKEALFRLSLVRMALHQNPFGRTFHRSDAFRSLDPTEKGAVSYFLGMTVCKLFASRLLNTPWLLHLDVFRDQLNPSVLQGRSRPDLVGEDESGNWHAFESKGRSSKPSGEDIRKAKDQARRLVSINGKACSLRIGAISSFRQDELVFYWCDPEQEEPEKLEPIEIRVPDDAWQYYYEPVTSLVALDTTLADSEVNDILDIAVEIHPEVYEILLEKRWAEARSVAIQMSAALSEQGYHQDGVKISCGPSWRRSKA